MKAAERGVAMAAAAGLAVMACGCALPAVYRPEVTGRVGEPVVAQGLVMEIEPEGDLRVPLGEPVVFRVRITNHGTSALYLPRDPDVVFAWVYADGSRDCFLRNATGSRRYLPHEVVRIAPGESIDCVQVVPTKHFPVYGVTEFRAFLRIPENTNPALEPFSRGRTASNAFGIVVARRA